MKHFHTWVGTAGLGAVLLMTACMNQAAPPTKPHPPAHTQSTVQTPKGANVIPSVDRDKKFTTNAHGHTYSGMGNALYSSMGSSHLHTGGPSTKLEAQLKAAGVHGVQALIVNDAIYLAPSTANTQSINQMDPMQSHLISNYSGSSSRGHDAAHTKSGSGTAGTLGTSDHQNTFAQARTQIERIYGTDTPVKVVNSKKGIQALETVKKQMKNHKNNQTMAEQLSVLIREAKR
ncbi:MULTISPECIES: hypothetical protein [Brevibacillus]|uniref:Sporulation protein n=1 Tax=Brevibacillus porteri TaxID=2126350 RepID=A0ABX5FPR1_9BACL|nr:MULTISPECIES: hypothetical protein [Brevibacillus]MDC0761503.1 hypothetical protein [Brevibacillus sp. AG]MED1800359.1 hypothetical protein [Brevibacillus porteri]MED2134060.1 hypothetical protein [Brevibacillus porteri]MED2745814.1 hypothetical protein [Brevibacillus porteri]MED2813004.1 hypothetical protein [Brevibacillus porteri]